MRAAVIEFGQMSDYPYAIVLQPLGHLCGYVAVPPGHPWHGADRLDPVLADLRVHGGVTYAGATTADGFPVPEEGHRAWWVGFDLAREEEYRVGGAGAYPRPREVTEETLASEHAIALSEIADLVQQATEAARWQSHSGL